MNHRHVYDERATGKTFDYELFRRHSTVVLRSCTGTGKTTAVAKHMGRYMVEHPKARLLSVTTRTTLCDQHALSFKELNMQHYLRTDNCDAKALTVCLNGLLRLSHLTSQEMSNYAL